MGLVTLTGTAGTGKTRLALQVAADLRDELPDGTFWVDLAPLRDPHLVTSAVAQVLGVREQRGTSAGDGIPLTQGLKESLRGKACLLLLDNFEQVVDAAPLLSELLAAAPHLKLLVTSRVVLRLRDEHEYPVSPLALPDPERLPPFPDLLQYAAVELFVQRARAARPEFALTPENGAAVAQICCRLDGLPLAIELAAARLRLFSPPALLSRLGDRLGLLTAGARDLPARQQTLRAALDWSYELLAEGERGLLRRLSVFVGGWTLAAAEGICSADGGEGREVLELLGQLVEKSLVVTEAQGEAVRYRLLETIREFGQEKLEAGGAEGGGSPAKRVGYPRREGGGAGPRGEAVAARDRHRDWYLAAGQPSKLSMGPDHENLTAALEWSMQRGDAQAALRLGIALHDRWYGCSLARGARAVPEGTVAAGSGGANGGAGLGAEYVRLPRLPPGRLPGSVGAPGGWPDDRPAVERSEDHPLVAPLPWKYRHGPGGLPESPASLRGGARDEPPVGEVRVPGGSSNWEHWPSWRGTMKEPGRSWRKNWRSAARGAIGMASLTRSRFWAI